MLTALMEHLLSLSMIDEIGGVSNFWSAMVTDRMSLESRVRAVSSPLGTVNPLSGGTFALQIASLAAKDTPSSSCHLRYTLASYANCPWSANPTMIGPSPGAAVGGLVHLGNGVTQLVMPQPLVQPNQLDTQQELIDPM